MNSSFPPYSYPIPDMPTDDDLLIKPHTEEEVVCLRVKLNEQHRLWSEFNRKKDQRLDLFLTIMTGVAIGIFFTALAAYAIF